MVAVVAVASGGGGDYPLCHIHMNSINQSINQSVALPPLQEVAGIYNIHK